VIARRRGRVVGTLGETVAAVLPGAALGAGVRILPASVPPVCGEIAALEGSQVRILPFSSLAGIAVGDPVETAAAARALPSGYALLGRAVDAAGLSLDGGPPLAPRPPRSTAIGAAPAPAERQALREVWWTGVAAIDGLLTIGRGARVGIFGAPGAGKTSLLEAIVGAARADAVVLALVGERGREAAGWLARLDRRTAIVCATSDRSSSERIRAAEAAMVQAETLRAGGLHVVLVVDSLARYVAALRERRNALGEAVGRGGYPPGVWSDLARFLERPGKTVRGSVTLLATVLSDGGDEREPLSDAARSLLDGHVVLSSELARAGRFPAIDILASASRTMAHVVDAEHLHCAAQVRAALARLARTADARELGLAAADDPALAAAVAAEPALERFLHSPGPLDPERIRAELTGLAASLRV
jgi:type III secretion protein N (ATPase)